MFNVRATLGLLGSLVCFTLISQQEVAADRYLPPAGFQVRSGAPTGNLLPHVSGVHLSEGEDRPDGGPAEVYNPGEPAAHFQLCRWELNKMPLAVWISPGLKLPDIPFDQIQASRVDFVTQMLNSPAGVTGLETAPGWTEHTNEMVAAGIEQWHEFKNVGIQFGFVDDPRQAQILVFFTDSFKDATGPGGISVGGVTSAQIYPVATAHSMKIRQKPVVIELSTMTNSSDERMMGASAHEFGHALGIKAHSDKRQDIMFRDRIVNFLSPSDKATIRYLYQHQPQWVL
jgi:predicted Zn-dependent protease